MSKGKAVQIYLKIFLYLYQEVIIAPLLELWIIFRVMLITCLLLSLHKRNHMSIDQYLKKKKIKMVSLFNFSIYNSEATINDILILASS